jgi:ribulose-5-phosphate 4-epimerase/fuculose-1-phosphate aldolase
MQLQRRLIPFEIAFHPTALILQNHGILTAGETIESAVAWFIMLERHCQVMLMSEAAAACHGQKPIVTEDEEAKFTHSKTGTETAGHFMSKPYFMQAAITSNGDHLN